jgi:hypothetical protein
LFAAAILFGLHRNYLFINLAEKSQDTPQGPQLGLKLVGYQQPHFKDCHNPHLPQIPNHCDTNNDDYDDDYGDDYGDDHDDTTAIHHRTATTTETAQRPFCMQHHPLSFTSSRAPLRRATWLLVRFLDSSIPRFLDSSIPRSLDPSIPRRSRASICQMP